LTTKYIHDIIFADERIGVSADQLIVERRKIMAGEFGRYIDGKRRGRASDGSDIMLKDIAAAMGITATYLSDIVKGRRNPPDMKTLEKIAAFLRLSPEEKAEMFDLAGREKNEAAPDLPSYIMDEGLPHVRMALRRANEKKMDDSFWEKVLQAINDEG
jgi:transcriptional regulator with XRE-family HTH domain